MNVTESDIFEGVIDEEAGVVRGVKLLGIRSKNRRKYTSKKAVESATRLLKESQIYIDHPQNPNTPRSYNDSFGFVVAESVQYKKGEGHFGDIRYCPEDSRSKKFVWDVKNNPNAMGMSINAVIKPGKTDKDGDLVVEEIEMIRSVDVVTRPGTAKGIFEHESEEPEMPITLETLESEHADIVEALLAKHQQTKKEANELEKLRKEAKEAQEQLAAIKAEKAAKELHDAIESEFTAFVAGKSLPDGMMAEIVECACQMEADSRKKLSGVVEKLMGLIPVGDEPSEDDTPAEDTEEQEKPASKKPAYRPGAGSGGAYSFRTSVLGK